MALTDAFRPFSLSLPRKFQFMLYREVKGLNLPEVDREILAFWEKERIFERSIENRNGAPNFVFYEGPPSANGRPGIHHVMARTVKDIFCRYQTLRGKKVIRKGGWDTHGLPIEISVENELGITKEDIGTTISVAEYNRKCRETVMRYKKEWDDITRKMGYWVDLEHPYITFENSYIESVWFLLKEIYNKGLLYKGFTIQPYSPAAGTGLSSHELNMPGAYKEVKDVSAVVLFALKPESYSAAQAELLGTAQTAIAAWTTTPWTLPSNCALAVGEKIEYRIVATYNPYTRERINVIMAEERISAWFKPENAVLDISGAVVEEKRIPFQVLEPRIAGAELEGLRYHPLFDYALPDSGDAHRVIVGDFVSTADGTGIVHIAPSFGADDMRAAKMNGIGSLTLVDKQGRFTAAVRDFAGEYVKEEYLTTEQKEAEKIRLGLDKYLSVDERIVIKLKKEGKLLQSQKYLHNYPHCWRTDKPVLYYPLDSWFIRITALKDRLISLNKTIKWKPEATGTGRFGHWLENLQDWNLSRSRFWGIPLPIWRSADNRVEKCIGSIAELKSEIERANSQLGLQQQLPADLHRPYIDEIILYDETTRQRLTRETDLIDVWFDSGAMPYAQHHYPFTTPSLQGLFPADFIAEGVDQTRGWFYTLHAIAAMISDSVAFKTVVSNGLVLDKNGNKMSKRLGNAVDPFSTLSTYGADATRWYMISNADPWENLKFDTEGITEVRNKFFGTLFNTYSFFAIYANIDRFVIDASNLLPLDQRSELDRWILSRLQGLIAEYTAFMDDYEPTRAVRAVEGFVVDELSNWYVRLSRRRFWKSETSTDKQAAFETLYQCLVACAQLIAPISPFFADWLYQNLTRCLREKAIAADSPLRHISVHLTDLHPVRKEFIDEALERRMNYARRICSLVLSLRKAEKIRVRQPLRQLLIPVLDPQLEADIRQVEHLIKSEVNVKEIKYVGADEGIVIKKAKPNFRALGKKLGRHMKAASELIAQLDSEQIGRLEKNETIQLPLGEEAYELTRDDVEIYSEDIPGWLVSTDGSLTVALDITITPDLLAEGHAKELINRIQNLRKQKDFQVTDRIVIHIAPNEDIALAVANYKNMICQEVLADEILIQQRDYAEQIEWSEELMLGCQLQRV